MKNLFNVQYTAFPIGAKSSENVIQGNIQIARDWASQAESDAKIAVRKIVGYKYYISVNVNLVK